MTSPNALLDDDAELRMFENVCRSLTKRRARQRRMHRIATVGVVSVVALSGTAAALVIPQLSPPMVGRVVECYDGPSLDARHSASYFGADVDANSTAAEDVDRAQGQCAAGWRVGADRPDHASIPEGKTFAVPQLVVCVLSNGEYAVFPSAQTSDEFCPSLGLKIPEA